MRRFMIAFLLVVAVGGWLVAGRSRRDASQHASAARLAASTPSGREQPLLPKLHPKVVEPIAGRENGAPASSPVDTGPPDDGSEDRPPTHAASAARIEGGPLDSGRLMHWGLSGPGEWVTIYASPSHVYMEVAGVRFDTSGAQVTGSRWQNQLRGRRPGFVARHPPGL